MQLTPLQNAGVWETHSEVTHWQLHACVSWCVCWCVPLSRCMQSCLCKCEFTSACTYALEVCCQCAHVRSTVAAAGKVSPGSAWPNLQRGRSSLRSTCARERSFSLHLAQATEVQPLAAWATICHHGDVHLQHPCRFSLDSCMLLLATSWPAKPAQIPQPRLVQHGAWTSKSLYPLHRGLPARQ